jgi:hypothetical protein
LLDLRATLADNRNQKRRSASVHEPQASSSTEVPQQRENGAIELTPRAPSATTLALPAAAVFDGADFDAMDFDVLDRPETPTPSRTRRDSGALLGTSKANLEDTADSDTWVLGRTPARVNSILNDAFVDIQKDLSDLAVRVRMPFQQVLNRFTMQFARTCATNHWNTYEKFYAANKDQEIKRLGPGATEITPSQCGTLNRTSVNSLCVKQYHQSQQ